MDTIITELLRQGGPDLEREYSPSSVAKDFSTSVAAYRSKSDAALHAHVWQRLPYGEQAEEIVVLTGDLSSTEHIHLFIHGGYWQELSWRDALFPVDGFVDKGMVYGAINYSLAPAASLDQIVDQCRRAVATVVRATRRNASPPTLTLSGSSAGAHLAAMMALTDWLRFGLHKSPVSALVLLSGIYALRPLVGTSINAALGLTVSDADRLSPLLLPATTPCPAVVAWGQYETGAFKKQSAAFAAHWAMNGSSVAIIEVVGRSHFDIVFDLSDPEREPGSSVFHFLKNGCSHHDA